MFVSHMLKKYWLVIPALLILLFSAVLVFEVRAQEDLVVELTTRLNQLGIPLKSIAVDNRLPFQITITLQSTSMGDRRTGDDAINEYMAYREAMLAHKFGLNLDSFILTLVNQQGEIIDWEQRLPRPTIYLCLPAVLQRH